MKNFLSRIYRTFILIQEKKAILERINSHTVVN
jgi:hypothetical protein